MLGNYKDAYENHKMYIIYRDSIANKENTEKIVQQKLQYEFDKNETQSRAEQAATKEELQRQKMVRNGFVGGFAVVLLFAILILIQRNKIRKEKQRSDELLLNILPDEVANEIKKHTGPVVAGIKGVKKYVYDIWGDTVNLSARMEQNSETGKINISGSTYELVKDKFKCIHRGKVEAKNKGEIDMFFLEI